MRLVPFLSISILGVSIWATPAAAQVTGVPGINDFTINGSVSGSTSCTPVTIPPASPITFNISAANPGALAAIIVGVAFPGTVCPCTAGWIPLPPSSCVGIQSIDFPMFSPACNTVIVVGLTDGSGNFSATASFCPPGTKLAAQAVVVDPACIPTRVWSQAYDIGCL